MTPSSFACAAVMCALPGLLAAQQLRPMGAALPSRESAQARAFFAGEQDPPADPFRERYVLSLLGSAVGAVLAGKTTESHGGMLAGITIGSIVGAALPPSNSCPGRSRAFRAGTAALLTAGAFRIWGGPAPVGLLGTGLLAPLAASLALSGCDRS